TVFVTTHFLEEADYCDRVSLIAAGKLVADAAPEALRARYADAYTIDLDVGEAERGDAARRLTEAGAAVEPADRGLRRRAGGSSPISRRAAASTSCRSRPARSSTTRSSPPASARCSSCRRTSIAACGTSVPATRGRSSRCSTTAPRRSSPGTPRGSCKGSSAT